MRALEGRRLMAVGHLGAQVPWPLGRFHRHRRFHHPRARRAWRRRRAARGGLSGRKPEACFPLDMRTRGARCIGARARHPARPISERIRMVPARVARSSVPPRQAAPGPHVVRPGGGTRRRCRARRVGSCQSGFPILAAADTDPSARMNRAEPGKHGLGGRMSTRHLRPSGRAISLDRRGASVNNRGLLVR